MARGVQKIRFEYDSTDVTPRSVATVRVTLRACSAAAQVGFFCFEVPDRMTRISLRPFARPCQWVILLTLTLTLPGIAVGAKRISVTVPSTIDDHQQPCFVVLPDGYDPADGKRPLCVLLHSWSAGVEQSRPGREAEATRRGWICLLPHFRGPNKTPDACGSLKAQQDILDAMAWTRKRYPIDEKRIYLMGVSGGGHMTMLMAGRYPELWTAASAWVGISDLAAWHKKHEKTKYGAMMRASCGGAPGDSAEVDRQYRARSPLTHLQRAGKVAIEFCAGIHDGHTGSVPVRHSLEAFNLVAQAAGGKQVSETEIRQLSTPTGRLRSPQRSDQEVDPALGREIHLRRYAGAARVTIFEGGHEAIDAAAMQWLERHVKP